MKKTITINGNTVELKPIDFEAICDLEELGFDFRAIATKRFSCIRSLFAFHADKSLSEASAEIEAHIKNGGNLLDFVSLVDAIADSDFFKAVAASKDSN